MNNKLNIEHLNNVTGGISREDEEKLDKILRNFDRMDLTDAIRSLYNPISYELSDDILSHDLDTAINMFKKVIKDDPINIQSVFDNFD